MSTTAASKVSTGGDTHGVCDITGEMLVVGAGLGMASLAMR